MIRWFGLPEIFTTKSVEPGILTKEAFEKMIISIWEDPHPLQIIIGLIPRPEQVW